MEDLIKVELFKNMNSFINEIELTMDLNESYINQIKKFISVKLKDPNSLEVFIKDTRDHLSVHESKFSVILFSKQKLKSDFYNFMNDIVLFNGLLLLNIFKDEVKNTKKDIIKYVYSIYMSCVFLSNNTDNLDIKLDEFILKVKNDAEITLKQEDIKVKKVKDVGNLKFPLQRRNALTPEMSLPNLSNMSVLPSMPNLSNIPGDFGNVMQSILGNPTILNIATEISQKMQRQQLNPMSMLSSLMSGNIENSPLQGLVEEIQQNVEAKITTGEINKEILETQAQTIMNSVGGGVPNNMTDMNDLIKNMMSQMN